MLDTAVILDTQVIGEIEVMVPRRNHEADRTTRSERGPRTIERGERGSGLVDRAEVEHDRAVSEYRFRGREHLTVELEGAFDPAGLAVPAGVELEPAEGPARVRLFAFFVEGIRIAGVPLLRASYAEVLWRVSVRADGEPAWWAICCDLGARGPRFAARRWVRYPVRAADVEVGEERVRVTAPEGELSIAVGPQGAVEPGEPGESAAVEPRRLITGLDAEWAVPWGDDGRGDAQVAAVCVERDTLSRITVGAEVRWAPTAVVRRGREHRCGTARRRRLAT